MMKLRLHSLRASLTAKAQEGGYSRYSMSPGRSAASSLTSVTGVPALLLAHNVDRHSTAAVKEAGLRARAIAEVKEEAREAGRGTWSKSGRPRRGARSVSAVKRVQTRSIRA